MQAVVFFRPNKNQTMNEDYLEKETSQIVLLGTGTPYADPLRCGSSVAIVVNQIPYIVDLGPGVVRRAAAAYQTGIVGLDLRMLKKAFVTHLHSDHTTGYPDFIFTPWVLGRDEPLEVYGPEGISAMTEHVLAAYQQDIDERIYGLEGTNRLGYRVNVTEIDPGIIYQDSNVKVEAFHVKHGSWQAFGYKFFTPDRTIVISGDTAPTETIIEKGKGCDVLIHEVYSEAGLSRHAPMRQKYHANVHTSSRELAEVASKVRPRLLILYHQLFWNTSEEELLLEIQEKYDGKVFSGKDLDVF